MIEFLTSAVPEAWRPERPSVSETETLPTTVLNSKVPPVMRTPAAPVLLVLQEMTQLRTVPPVCLRPEPSFVKLFLPLPSMRQLSIVPPAMYAPVPPLLASERLLACIQQLETSPPPT